MSETTPPSQPPHTPGPPPQHPQHPQLSPSDERLWATLVHLGGILFGFIPALVGYLILKDKGPFVHAHTATALNFQITMTIAHVVAMLLWIVLVGTFITLAIWILVLIFSIQAALAANRGEYYTYPLSIVFVK